MFPGIDVKLGAETYTIPALSLGQLRNGGAELLKQHDQMVADGPDGFSLSLKRAEIILLAAKRNYPDMTAEKLEGLLDLNNIFPIWQTVLGLSGFTLGEAPAAPRTEQVGT